MTLTGTLTLEYKSEEFLTRYAEANGGVVLLPVVFERPFPAPPAVHLGISAFAGGGEHFAFRVTPVHITELGFDIQLQLRRSWIETIDVSWIACET